MRADQNRGLALITVLWLISLLTILATAMLAITRSHGRMAARAAQGLAAETIADSAIRITLLRINAPLREERTFNFSANWRLTLFDQPIEVKVEREAGRVDLNAAAEPLLAAVFSAGGIELERSRAFASRVLEWRRNKGAFVSIGELRQVTGLDDLSPEILDAFTVYSTRSPTIAREFAHPLVLEALESLSAPPVSMPGHLLLTGQVVRVQACLTREEITRCRTAIARLTGNASKPFLIYDWFTASRSYILSSAS
jgi:type II secretory pathway component PulK